MHEIRYISRILYSYYFSAEWCSRKKRTWLFKKWLKPCCITRMWLETCREKPLTYHTVNKVYFRPGTKKTPYELWKGRKPNVKYFRIFGSAYFILNDRENVRKFDSRSDEGIFLGYSSTSKAYQVYNKRTMKVMETMNVVIDESLNSGSEKFSEEIS